MSLPKSVYERKPKRLPKSLGFSRYALDFDGVDDYVEVPDDPSLDITRVTYGCWMYPRTLDADAYNTPFSKRYDGTDTAPEITHTDADELAFVPGSPADTGAAASTSWHKTGEWHFIAGTYDGATMRLYDNGELIATYDLSGDAGTNDTSLKFGDVSHPTAHQWFDGIIDEALVYDHALSQSEIREIMLDYQNPIKDGLVGWWRLEEGTGSTAHDGSGEGNDGTLKSADTDLPAWTDVKEWELRSEVSL